MSRKAEIKLTVDLDDDNLPTAIQWEATDAPAESPASCKALMLSLWESESQTTAAIDLWTKDTTVEELSVYFHQAFHKMADTYLRATRNAEIANLIHEFGDDFGTRVGLR